MFCLCVVLFVRVCVFCALVRLCVRAWEAMKSEVDPLASCSLIDRLGAAANNDCTVSSWFTDCIPACPYVARISANIPVPIACSARMHAFAFDDRHDRRSHDDDDGHPRKENVTHARDFDQARAAGGSTHF